MAKRIDVTDGSLDISPEDSLVVIRSDGSQELHLAMETVEEGETPEDNIIEIHDSAWIVLAIMNFLKDDAEVLKRIQKLQAEIDS
jgi:hypothetical protein